MTRLVRAGQAAARGRSPRDGGDDRPVRWAPIVDGGPDAHGGPAAVPRGDVGAPGIGVRVAWAGGGSIVATGNCFAAVARLLSAQPHLSPVEVKAALRAVARNAVLHR